VDYFRELGNSGALNIKGGVLQGAGELKKP